MIATLVHKTEGSPRPRVGVEAPSLGGGRRLPDGCRRAVASICLAMLASPSIALTLADCTRVTHASHGGEARHVDLGADRVAWVSWWSQEGVFTDFHVAECDAGRALTTRAREENIKDRWFNRTDAVSEILDRHIARAPALFSLEALAADLKTTGEDTRIEAMDQEPCACAAAYPDHRGGRLPFVLNDAG